MSVLAFDLGASSGRAYVGEMDGDRLRVEEIHRFSNDPVRVGNRLHWDILRLLHEIKQGILKAKLEGYRLQSIAIDSWAVDFGLLDENGELLGNPYHYRDPHVEGVMENVFRTVSRKEIFSRTGIQFLPFNTIYQLAALQKADSVALSQAKKLLMIPDLLRYFLTGEKKGEFTNATTTQLFNPLDGDWDEHLLQDLGLSKDLFPEVVSPGTVVGTLSNSVCEELDIEAVPVIAVGEHDTASAVAGVPAENENFAYLSSGTWSLMGTEVGRPVMNAQALAWNFTNEGGVEHTFRLLKNIMGLWILQECKRAWEKEGNEWSYPELIEQAQTAAPFQSLIDPDDLRFLHPTNMPRQIQSYCEETGQKIPQSVGEIVRCVMESLALKYRYILERTEELAGKSFEVLHMVGGGIQNEMLCQFTANSIGKPVLTGPSEASAMGNIAMQFVTLGKMKNIREGRKWIRRSVSLKTYLPEDEAVWKKAYEKFCEELVE